MSNPRPLLRVLRNRDYRLLWLANTTSTLGDRIVTVALALFVVDLTGSATDLGLVLTAYLLPLIAFLLLGGVLADRLPRHLVVVVTDLLRFALHALLALLIVSGEVRIWHLVAIGVLFGTAEAFYRPAATALLPQTVPEDEIQEAQALVSASECVAVFLGPALATLLVLGIGPAVAFGLDAATFLVSAALLVRVRPRERGSPPAQDRAPTSIRDDLREGYDEVRSRRWVWVTLAVFCVVLFVAEAPLIVVGPIVAQQLYGDVAVFGYLLAAMGGGTIAGSLVALRWRPRHPLRLAMTFVLAWPAAIVPFAAGAPLAVVLPAMALAGCGLALFDIWWSTALAERIPPSRLSRVTSYDWTVSFALMPLGCVLAGPAAHVVGATGLLLGGALVALVVLPLGLLPRETRMLERLDVERPAPGALVEAAAGAPAA
ncbi:MAG TPA: MFS transporter [Solirubrobacteraceae bacterium]|jgi:MFS family permease|nr:MFS transporter [Solirubrobacteraceae bacterium]